MGKKINFPTILTILRIVLAVPFLILMIIGGDMQYIFALVIFVVAALTDKIDGDYARKHHQVTDLGKFLDPLADKMLVDTAFLCLVVVGVAPVWVFMIIIWRDLAVDGMRMMLAQKKVVLAASMWGKIKTTAQMATLVVLILDLILGNGALAIIGDILLYVVAILTIVSGAEILIKGFKKLD